MTKVNVYEIKAKMSEYLNRAVHGERIVICRHNKPVAELRAIEDVRTKARAVGPLRGRPTFEIPASFFEPMSEVELTLWEAGDATDPLSAAWTPKKAIAPAKGGAPKYEKSARRTRRPARRP